MVYSVVQANLEYTINSETQQSISCMSPADNSTIYTGVDQNVWVWNLDRRKLIEYVLFYWCNDIIFFEFLRIFLSVNGK